MKKTIEHYNEFLHGDKNGNTFRKKNKQSKVKKPKKSTSFEYEDRPIDIPEVSYQSGLFNDFNDRTYRSESDQKSGKNLSDIT
jgi:hypothetical protein